MLHASSPAPHPNRSSNGHSVKPPSSSPSPSPSPASAFIQRLHSSRSASYDSTFDTSAVQPYQQQQQQQVGYGDPTGSNGNGEGYVGFTDLRRATSLRAAGPHGGTYDPSPASAFSFGTAASNLSSPSNQNQTIYTAPAAARHALFSHHALPPGGFSPPPASIDGGAGANAVAGPSSPSMFSDPGPLGPPSPSASDVSSGAFSPASAFLSHFSSSTSLRAPSAIAPDAQGARVLDYTLGKIIGRGGFSTVRKATNITTGEIFACKIVKRDDLSDRSGSLEKFEDEISIWRTLPRHQSILPLLDMHRTPFATFLIMPFLPGGSLLEVLQREGGSDKTARKFFPGVVAAVSALHEGTPDFEGGILHGDLKLDNFLVDHAGGVMVCDFYMAQKIEGKDRHGAPVTIVPPPLTTGVMRHTTLPTHFHRGPRMSSPLPAPNSHRIHDPSPVVSSSHEPVPVPAQPFPSASLPYAPPELLRGPRTGPALAQDIWAVGIILHALLTGRLPFVDSFDPRLQMKILRGTWDEPPDMGREWLECLRGCLDGNVETRWKIQRVRESDAVLGWAEVKSRSKSRSRSRARRPSRDGLLDSRRRDGPSSSQALPVPILSPNVRLRASSSASRERARGRGPGAYGSLPAEGPYDFFYPFHEQRAGSGAGGEMGATVPPPQPRSRSASASRSRSSGRTPMFEFDAPDLVRGLESVDITRGRSARRDHQPIGNGNGNRGLSVTTSVQGLPFHRQSASMISIDGLSLPWQSRSNSLNPASGSGSTSRSHSATPSANANGGRSSFTSLHPMSSIDTDTDTYPPPLPPGAAPPYSTAVKARSPCTSRSRSSKSSTSISTSPNVNVTVSTHRDGRSRDRDRDGHMNAEGKWEVPERYEYGRELRAVHEDGGRGRRSRSRGRS